MEQADKDVFISYSRKDKDIVFTLVERIEAEIGPRCWIDWDGIHGEMSLETR